MVNSDEISVVINSSYIPSHPKTDLLEETVDSLHHLDLAPDVPILIVQDALRERRATVRQKTDYQNYLDRVQNWARGKDNVQVVLANRWGHISGSLRLAYRMAQTPFVMVVQHDLPFSRKAALGDLLDVMRAHPRVKHVRFNINAKTAVNWDLEYEYGRRTIDRRHFLAQEYFETGEKSVPLVRTLAWSDNNYVCSRDYLESTIFFLTGNNRVPPEHVLNPLGSPERHDLLGTYIFGEIDDPPYIRHLDGRRTGLEDRDESSGVLDPWWHGITKHVQDKWLKIQGQARFNVLRSRQSRR